MIIQNTDIYSTFWNLITFILEFLTNNIPFILILCIGIYLAGLFFRTLTFQK